MSEFFKIESNIPFPVDPRSKGYSDAIRSLAVGESVLLPTKASSINSCLQRMYRKGEQIRGSFKVRAEGENARIWRIAPL